MVTRIFLSHVNVDYMRPQLWAVDVSTYTLWQAGSKGEALIDACLSCSPDEQARVKRYLREMDQIRSLAGKMLVRLAVCTLRRDIGWDQLRFESTKEGRPFLSSPLLDFDYNITHDGDWVVVAFHGTGADRSEKASPTVGVDVMEIHLPRYEKTVGDFVETMDMTLTPHERSWVLSPYATDTFVTHTAPPAPLTIEQYDQLKKLYTLWTYKEAFTKSKGLGLSFDFQNIDIKRGASFVSLTACGIAEDHLHFFEVRLPPGQCDTRTGRPGAGTGLDSLLVAVQSKQEGVLLSRMDAKQAEQDGLLRIWTMESLVGACRGVSSNGDKGT